MSVFDVIVFGWGGVLLLIAWAIALAGARTRGDAIPLTFRFAMPALFAIGAVAYWTDVAIYVRFVASRPALEKYVRDAQRARTGSALAEWTRTNSRSVAWVGLFRVSETEALNDGTVRLITGSCMFDDCGLVFSPRGAPLRIEEDWFEHLVGRWWQWRRSW